MGVFKNVISAVCYLRDAQKLLLFARPLLVVREIRRLGFLGEEKLE